MFSKTLNVCFILLATLSLVWAEGSGDAFASADSFSESDLEGSDNDGRQSMFPQFPFFPDFSSIFSGSGSGSGFPSFPGFGSLFSGFGGGSRSKRAIEDDSNEDSEQQSRFFFNFPSFVNCNATTQLGRRCLNCQQVLTCNSNNFGVLRTCRGLFRHCNNGRCSLFQSSACASGSVAATTESATTAAPTAAATTAAPTTTA